jgi:hypothetical protein
MDDDKMREVVVMALGAVAIALAVGCVLCLALVIQMLGG